jgi:exopolysaccharide production protein ExoQ
MNDVTPHNAGSSSTDRGWLWLAIALVGAVFFFAAHDLEVSRHEGFAPWSDADGTLESGRNVVKGLALGLIGALGVCLILRRDGRPLRLDGWLPTLMILYLAWSAASVLWSIDRGMSCRRLAVLMFCVLGAVGFARQFRPRDLLLMAIIISGAFLLAGVAAELLLGTFRPWSPGYRFGGTVHPNTQGAHLAVLCLGSVCLAQSTTHRKPWLWALFGVGLFFLLLTKSRTSCAALAIALAALWWLNTSGRTRTLAALTFAFLICAAALAGTLFGLDVDDELVKAAMLGRHEEAETLTGRIPIWNELLNYVRARPLEGYGYESFWTADHIEAVSDELQWPLREAHNAYIGSVLSVGLIGTAAFLAAVLLALRRAAAAYRQTGDPGFAFTVCLLLFGLVGACLEAGMMSPNFITLMAGSGALQLLAIP